MDCILHPCYFPNIAHFVGMYHADTIYLEVCDNYQKQTYRNRTEIFGANGKLSLTIPVVFSQKNRQAYKDIKIFNKDNWQHQHLKSLKAAYSASPFFEFYIDDLLPLFTKEFNFLLDFNLFTLELLEEILQLKFNVNQTLIYDKHPKGMDDLRFLVNPKKQTINVQPYTQMFSHKHGFISNLSILDLLFNEGPASELYLSKQQLSRWQS